MHDGASYEGNWKDGTFHGHGVWTWRDGRQFKGDFKRDHPVEGVLTHEGTDRFVRWDLTSGTFVDPRPAAAAGIGGGGGQSPAVSPSAEAGGGKRWSGGGAAQSSVAADAATPPANPAGLWAICASARTEKSAPSVSGGLSAVGTARTHNTYDEDMEPLPVKETWCSHPPGRHANGFDDHRRRICSYFGLV